MAQRFTTLTDLANHSFDALIDVRSPAEFAIDHVPGAINLPALSNDERVKVGTIYKQVSPFQGRKLGASLVLENLARHIAGPLADFDGGWQPLVYCWRGGQRSGVFTTILKEIGWRADVIEGGYQTYRRLVHDALYQIDLPHRIVLLDGYTGTAKTALLPRLKSRGVQIIDLEGLAGHRGSLIGAMPGGQPSQRMFETQLAQALAACDPSRPTLLEAESNKIGRINIPPSLWSQMIAAPRIDITAPVAARTAFLTQAYADILRDPDTVKKRLNPLRRVRGHEVVDHWQALQDAGDYAGLAQALIVDHYDAAYDKSRKVDTRKVVQQINVDDLGTDGLNQAADAIAKAISAL